MYKLKSNIKLSFTGDIMCEKPLLNAAFNDGKYNFDRVFSVIQKTFNKSDFVVGNLETVCAGKEFGYTNHIYSFNTPEEFVASIKKSGIDLVTTATNHCLDRGIEGLKKNLEVLDKYKLDSIGTYASIEDRSRVFVKDFNGIKVAFLNYTYGTNTLINEVVLDEKEWFHVNLLQPQTKEVRKLKEKKNSNSLKSTIARKLFQYITIEDWIKIKRKFGLFKKAYQDNDLSGIDSQYLEQIKKDINKARDEADIVVMCMHSGGQFNIEPGEFTKYMMNFMSENGVDVVVGNHPHLVQRCEKFESGMFAAYSLGNFSLSPSSVYVLHENLPEYSIMLHLYLNREDKNKIISKITFSILKIVEDQNKYLTVYPLTELIKKIKSEKEKEKIMKEATIIYNRFLNKNEKCIELKEEYLV